VPIPGYEEDRWNYQGQGPGYQPLHERTQTMYVNPALAGTTFYDSWYPEADFDRETGDLSGDLSKKEFLRLNEPLFPPQITNPYPFEPDYAALWAGDQYMERKGDEPAFYDATQMYNDRLADDYVDWLESPERQAETLGTWEPPLTLGTYWGDNDRITLNTGLIRGAGPEMMGGSGIDRFGHEQRQEWDTPGWDMAEPHWRDYMDEVVRHEVKHSGEREFGSHVPYPKDKEINPMTGMMERAPPGSGAKLHREIYMSDPIWSERHPLANEYSQGLPATWKEAENVMAMHNYAKNQYLRSQPAERPNMRDVAGPVRGNPVTQDRVVRGSGPSRARPHFSTGGLVSLVL
jgi:hypothetical protein